MTQSVLQFGNIRLANTNSTAGSFKISEDKLVWKGSEGNAVSISSQDIEDLEWMAAGPYSLITVHRKSAPSRRFVGFRNSDFDAISGFLKESMKRTIEKKKLSARGCNWGDISVQGSELRFENDEEMGLGLPLGGVCQASVQGQQNNEVALEFHQEDTQKRDEHGLVEMRLFVPPGLEMSAEDLKEDVLQHADTSTFTGTSFVKFEQLALLNPRGRYDMELFKSYLRMHGKTFDYKVLYTSIVRLFFLPKPDRKHCALVISLDPPLRQGETQHHHLVLNFVRDDEVEVELNLSDEELKEYPTLKQQMSGKTDETVATVFKALSGRPMSVPKNFRSHSGDLAVTCSLRANTGYLYPLERCLFFVNKPPTCIRYPDVSSIEFARMDGYGGYVTTFDITVSTASGQSYTFTSIHRNEYANLRQFFKEKGLNLENDEDITAPAEVESAGSEDDVADANYKRQLAAERNAEGDEGMDSDSEDEDFRPPSESSSDGGVDSGSEGSSSEGADGGSPKAKPKKKRPVEAEPKEKPSKKRPRESDAESSASEGAPDTPPKKKAAAKKSKPAAAKKTKEVVQKGKKGKKKAKDPNAPKRPLSSFLIFSAEKRESVKEENPELSAKELLAKLGELWRGLSTEDKEPYNEKAKDAKAEYERRKKEYDATKAAAAESASGEESSGSN